MPPAAEDAAASASVTKRKDCADRDDVKLIHKTMARHFLYRLTAVSLFVLYG
jgi:hypothetical protein